MIGSVLLLALIIVFAYATPCNKVCLCVGNAVVRNENTQIEYSTIQEAINANETLGGHTIRIPDVGIWREHVVVNKSITLEGTWFGLDGNGSMTVIDGDRSGTVVAIKADNASIRFIEIRNGVDGIVFDQAKNVRVQCVRVNDNVEKGIWLRNSNNCTMTEARTANNHYGIYADSSSDNTFHDNAIEDNIVQVFSFNSTNAWDNGFEGNYWSDFVFRYPDAFQLPNGRT